MLSDEVKWLAVTHKSFDHGRRGFNDRLAYIGMWEAMRQGMNIAANGSRRTTHNRVANITSPHQLTARDRMAERRKRQTRGRRIRTETLPTPRLERIAGPE